MNNAVDQFAGIRSNHPMHSEDINELATALAKAQGAIKGATKDASNPFFKSKYADLTSVWDACRDALTDNGLAVIQTTDANNGKVTLVTTLAHSSGQWIRGTFPVNPVKDDPQGLGSAMTYARRYSLAAMVGIAPKGEDDDAESAMGRKETTPKTETARDVWLGPLKKTEFKKAMQDFGSDLMACEDYDQLVALLNIQETRDLIEQCERDQPSWYYGTGSDVVGLKERIESRKEQLSSKADYIPPSDGGFVHEAKT